MAKNISVLGIYANRATVSDALDVLNKAGYRAADISVLWSDNQGSKDFAHQKQTKALQGAAVGAAAGGVIGAALAWFASTQPASFSAVGPILAAGPIVAAIVGAGAGGALGWIVGLLAGLSLTEYVAKRFAGRIRNGGILLSVHCDSPEWCERARKTLKDSGARDISSAGETAADYGATDKPTERAPAITAVSIAAAAPPASQNVPVEVKK